MQSRMEIEEKVRSVLAAIQADSGQLCPVISESTTPLTDLPGFDSLACVDAEVRLSSALGVELDHVVLSPTGTKRTVREIVAKVSEACSAAGKNNRGRQ